MFNEKKVFILWKDKKIISFAFSRKQLLIDARKKGLSGITEERMMKLYLIDRMAKSIAKDQDLIRQKRFS